MQLDGALQGGASRPRRRLLNVLVAIVVIAAMVALLVMIWASPFASSGVGAEDAKPNAGAGSAIVHDDAGNMHRNAGAAVNHDDAGYVNRD